MQPEQVMDALWPDAQPDVAANQLHKAAHYARRGAGEPGCVVLRNDLSGCSRGRASRWTR